MFTIKLYGMNGRSRIEQADSFTIVRQDFNFEITLHRKTLDDVRFDVSLDEPDDSDTTHWEKAIIENQFGATTEVITAMKRPRNFMANAPAPRS